MIRTAEEMREAAARACVETGADAWMAAYKEACEMCAASIRALPIAPAPDREALVEIMSDVTVKELNKSFGTVGDAMRAVLTALEAAGALR